MNVALRFSAAFPSFSRQGGVPRDPFHRVRQQVRPSRGNYQGVNSVGEHTWKLADSGQDERETDACRLHDGDRHAFVVGRQCKDVSSCHEAKHISAQAEESEPVTEAQPAVDSMQLVGERPVTDRDERYGCATVQEVSGRLEEDLISLLRSES